MSVFISHSSRDGNRARRLESALEARGLDVWLYTSDLAFGGLLRRDLQTSIERSRLVLLLWSAHARASRWVAAELLTAFHLGRFVIPLRVDEAPLPRFLEGTVYPVLGGAPDAPPDAEVIGRLERSIRSAPDGPNPLRPVMRSQSRELKEAIEALITSQSEEMGFLSRRKLDEASEIHRLGGDLLEKVLALFPLDTDVLNLAGYHHKNEYMLVHWDAIQASQSPEDPLLLRAERFFFDTLFVDPQNCSGLDGIGSVLLLEGELEASEFFLLRAIEFARLAGIDYTAAKENLATVHRYLPPRADVPASDGGTAPGPTFSG